MGQPDLPATFEAFADCLSQPLTLDDGMALTVTQVTGPGPGPDGRPFVVVLSGPPAPVAAEGLWRLSRADGAGWTLHLMPVHTPAAGRQDYQAVFN